MNIVLVGARGLLGSALLRYWNDNVAPGKTDDRLVPLDLPEFDCTARLLVEETLDQLRPDVVVNAVGVNMIDYLETHPNTARTIHAQTAVYLRQYAERSGARLVQISDGEVFYTTDPSSGAHGEDDRPNPESVYAKTKLESERVALECANALVVRTSTLFGGGGNGNLVQSLLNAARRSRRVHVLSDVVVSPTWTADLARAVAALVRLDRRGVFHVVNRGSATPCDVAKYLFAKKGLTKCEIVPITLEEYGITAPHSRNTALDTARYDALEDAPDMSEWRDALDRYLTSGS